jgi:cellulose 1,4-beta-cellobiosidase
MPRKLVLSVVVLVLMFIAGCGSSQAPSTPTLAVTTSSGVVVLSWAAVSGASSYVVFRGTSADIVSKTAIINESSTSYTDSSAVTGTTYHYQITAANSDYQSSPSNDVFVVGPIVLSSSSSNAMDWVGDTAAASYAVYRSDAADMSGSIELVTGVTTTNYTDSTTGLSGLYYYQVKAFDSSLAQVNLSNIISITY